MNIALVFVDELRVIHDSGRKIEMLKSNTYSAQVPGLVLEYISVVSVCNFCYKDDEYAIALF